MSAAPITTASLQLALSEWFAPWVQDLRLEVLQASGSEVTLRLPLSAAITRIGDVVCGQALMAAADTAMVLALTQHLGGFRPMTTVQLNTSFLRPLSAQDAWVQALVLRAGKSLAFGEITVTGASDGKCVSKSSTTYALL
jgi:acyl-coenzyme A thioesterase PaaI-like protein